MFVRTSNNGVEFKRADQTFYKGIVVKNYDPQKLYRVKVYIPEISNQPLEDWLNKYKRLNFRFPGRNNKQDVWRDTKIFEEISKFIPYAEPCFSLIGENGPGRYQSPEELAVITDSNYEETFETNNETPPTLERGAYAPSFWYENKDTNVGDRFAKPLDTYTANNNPYAFMYRPSKHDTKPKGLFCVPSVGSQVWVFHYQGDLNFPVYFGGRHDARGNLLITNSHHNPGDPESLDYPGVFENYKNM